MNHPAVLEFLAGHHWVASTDQLQQLGVSRSALEHARRTGVVIPAGRGVVAVKGVALSFEGRALAAQLTAGREAFVSGPSAGVLYGLREMPRERIEITIKQTRRVGLPERCRLVRASWIDEQRDVVVRDDGIRVATPLRTLFGLAAQFNQHRFERAAEDVWHKGLVTPHEAADFLESIRRSGRTGVRRMNTWLECTTARPRPSQSGLELDFVALIERVGLPTPRRQHPLVLPSGELIHLDVAWPDVRLAVEPGHSWWHGGDLRQRRDQARDRGCGALGWLVVRYDEAATRDAATARELLAIYRQRAAQAILRSASLAERAQVSSECETGGGG